MAKTSLGGLSRKSFVISSVFSEHQRCRNCGDFLKRLRAPELGLGLCLLSLLQPRLLVGADAGEVPVLARPDIMGLGCGWDLSGDLRSTFQIAKSILLAGQ